MEKQLMESEINSIQKFTDQDSVESILRGVNKLTPEHISLLSRDKKSELSSYITETL